VLPPALWKFLRTLPDAFHTDLVEVVPGDQGADAERRLIRQDLGARADLVEDAGVGDERREAAFAGGEHQFRVEIEQAETFVVLEQLDVFSSKPWARGS